MREDPTEAENFETADSQGFISTEEVLSLPSAEGALSPPETLPLIGKMCWSSSDFLRRSQA